jgi:hypothetical protein
MNVSDLGQIAGAIAMATSASSECHLVALSARVVCGVRLVEEVTVVWNRSRVGGVGREFIHSVAAL